MNAENKAWVDYYRHMGTYPVCWLHTGPDGLARFEVYANELVRLSDALPKSPITTLCVATLCRLYWWEYRVRYYAAVVNAEVVYLRETFIEGLEALMWRRD